MKPPPAKPRQHAIDRWQERGNGQDIQQQYQSSILYGGQLTNKRKENDSWLFITQDQTAVFVVRKSQNKYYITTILTPHQAQANIQAFSYKTKHKRQSQKRKCADKKHKHLEETHKPTTKYKRQQLKFTEQ